MVIVRKATEYHVTVQGVESPLITVSSPSGTVGYTPITLAELEALADANDLRPHQSFVVTDTGQVAVVLSANNFLLIDGDAYVGGAPTLAALGGTFSLAENAIAGAISGTLTGTTSGSTLSLTDDAGGRVALSGNNVVRGATALDYESATSHSFTVRETLAGATNTPRDTVLSLNVTNISEVTLAALGGTFTLAEDAAAAAVAGALTGVSSGSTLSLVDDAGGRVALSGSNIVRGATGLDYESATSHSFTVREIHTDGTNSPRDTVLTLNVTNVYEQPTLTSLSLDDNTQENGVAATINILGATTGSTITLQSGALPTGMTLNSAARTITGTPTVNETASFTLRETLADSSNSPLDTALDIIISSSGFAITTPVLADALVNPNVAGDLRPSYNIDFVDAAPTGGGIGDTIQMQWGLSEAAAIAMTPEEAVVDESWWIPPYVDPMPLLGDFSEVQSIGATVHYRVKIKPRAGSGDESDWSNFKTLIIADGSIAAPGLTDLTDQTVSTRVWSSSFAANIGDNAAFARLTGTGPIEVNSVVYEAGEEVIVAEGDTIRIGVDTSASGSTPVDNIVSNRGVTVETFTATTAGASSVIYTASATTPSLTTGGTTSKTISSIAFGSGRALIFCGVQGGTPGVMTLTPSGGGTPINCTKIVNTGSISLYRSDSDLTAGNYDLAITNSDANNFMVDSGTILNSGTVANSGTKTWGYNDVDFTTGSVTCPTDGLIMAWFGGEAAIAAPVLTSGTQVRAQTTYGSHRWGSASRDTTGAITWTFGNNWNGGLWVAFNKV